MHAIQREQHTRYTSSTKATCHAPRSAPLGRVRECMALHSCSSTPVLTSLYENACSCAPPRTSLCAKYTTLGTSHTSITMHNASLPQLLPLSFPRTYIAALPHWPIGKPWAAATITVAEPASAPVPVESSLSALDKGQGKSRASIHPEQNKHHYSPPDRMTSPATTTST